MQIVAYLCAHLFPELVQLLLANDARVPKPPPVRLDSGVGKLLGLEVLQNIYKARMYDFRLVARSVFGAILAAAKIVAEGHTWCMIFPVLSLFAVLLYILRRRTCISSVSVR